jgi:hypothetical protein
MMFCSVDEPEFKNIGKDKAKAIWIIDAIEKTSEPPKGSDLINVVKLSIVKDLVCMEISEQNKLAFHDLETLKPTTQLIGNYFQAKDLLEVSKLDEGCPKIDKLLTLLYKMASTGQMYNDPSHLRQIIIDRQDFKTYRSILKELDSLYKEIKAIVIDDETAQRKLEIELLRIKDFVDSELYKIKKKTKSLMLPIQLLSIPGLSALAENINPQLEKKHVSLAIESKHNALYTWFYAFQKLLSKAPKSISSEKFEIHGEIEHSSWCCGKLPWYADNKNEDCN